MPNDYSNENHLNKDELLQILNEIDSEKRSDHLTTNDHHKDVDNPNSNNPFY